MAIYHYSVGIISRSKGRSATAAAAYRAAERIEDIRTGEIHDYRKKKGVDEKFILAPVSAPDWVYNRSLLWNGVELRERQKNSQLSREINVAIPVELTKSEQVELVREFVKEQFVSEGMIADVAFHNLSSHNPHAHIMLTMRNIDKDGFSRKKNRDWNRRELLEKQREAWADHANKALELAKVNEKIDHRTLEEQGINRIPQIHLGANVNAMMKRGIATEKGDKYQAYALVNSQLAVLEKEIEEEEKLSPPSASPHRTIYIDTARAVRSSLGVNISYQRLDLEVYLRTDKKAELIAESDYFHQLEERNPRIAKNYVKAIAHVASTYKSLSDKRTPNLDAWAVKMVNSQMAKLQVSDNNVSQNISQRRGRGRSL